MSQNLDRLPPQAKYIVGNEACERFSFYGVKSILTGYVATLYVKAGMEPGDAEKATAKAIVHLWVFATYFLPLVGAWLADRYWGRYRTILWLSLAYCVGHATLAVGEGTKWGLFVGLAFLAIGSGGIKPCVSAFVGDQFQGGREHQLTRIYNLFYWSINFGAFFAFAFIPELKAKAGYSWAFGIPGIAMGIATLIFWLGSRTFVKVPPARELAPLDDDTRAENRRILWRIAAVFAPIIIFWSLYDQQNTTWAQQGGKLTPCILPLIFWNYTLNGETMQTLNALFILLFIPLFTYVIYPWLERRNLKPSLLARMSAGMAILAVAFGAAAWLEYRIESGEKLSVLWQTGQYALLTFAEVLVSTTGLEFAFRHAPASLKSTIMSLWLLAISFGNLLTSLITWLNQHHDPASGKSIAYLNGSQEMLLYIGLMICAVFAFITVARRFEETGGTRA